METTDLTPVILQNIRDDIAKLEAKLDAKFDAKIDKLDAKLEAKFEELDARISKCVTRDEFRETVLLLDTRIDRLHTRLVENDLRATTNHHELRGVIDRILAHLDDRGALEHRVDRCERDIVDLKARVF